MAEFDGKVVVITGASSGIGQAAAMEFAKLGAKLMIAGRNPTRLADVAKQCLDNGAPEVGQVVSDLATEEGVKAVYEATMEKFGTIHVLINNAGGSTREELTIPRLVESGGQAQALDYSYSLMVRAIWHLSGLFAPELIKTKGTILNTTSILGIVTIPSFPAYGVMKAAANYMTRCMATELGRYGVRVNAVMPGFTDTDFGADIDFKREFFSIYANKAHVLEQKVLEPVDVARSMVFLTSSAASRITGALLPVDGGGLLGSRIYDFTGPQQTSSTE